jgi:multidrug efflux system outer membrane protein
MKPSCFSLFGLIAALAGGCSVGPNYHPPAVNAPSHWTSPLAGGETNAPTLDAWWKKFHDPELESLVTRAVQSNLGLRVAEARVREARAQRGVIAADLWPTVGATGSYTRNRLSKHGYLATLLPPGTPVDYNLYEADFDASWEIDVFGGTRRAVEAAGAEVAAAEFNRRDVLVSLLAEVARNYIEARGLQQRLTIAGQNAAAQRDALNITRDRYRQGLTSDLDVQQAAALLSATEAQIPALEILLKASIHRLGVLLGQPPGALLTELSSAAPVPALPPEVPVDLPADLLRRRPDVRRAERELAAATARIGVAVADLFPKFSLTGVAGLQSVSASDWFTGSSRLWTVGPTMQWRIFEAGRIRANVRVQTARQQQALAHYEQTVLNSFEEVENALVAYANEQVRFRSLEATVDADRNAVAMARDLYQNGLADFLRVLDAQRSLYQAEDELAQSRLTMSLNLVALYKALGGGWQTGSPSGAPT